MELILERIAKRKTYTIGRLYIRRQVVDEYLPGTADDYFCDTLEPTWRDYANGAYKVKGRSAIPEGNCSEDTEGCILVGKNREVGSMSVVFLCQTQTFFCPYSTAYLNICRRKKTFSLTTK